jgi:hypothetical protein
MTATSSSDKPFDPAEPIPFADFAKAGMVNGNVLSETAKLNAQVSTTLQNIGREWSAFVGLRLREDLQLMQSIHDCRSLGDLQQAYARFWQNAFTQYGEETQRMLRIAQGAVEEAAGAAKKADEPVATTSQEAA